MKMRVYNEKGNSLLLDYDAETVSFHSVHICKKLKIICFGTSIGSVRVYLWPFLSQHKDQLEYIDVAIHQSPTNLIRITYDFEYIVSASLDGS